MYFTKKSFWKTLALVGGLWVCANVFVLAQDSTKKDGGTTAAAPAGGLPTDEASLAKGKELWEGNCTSCHAATDEVVVGPGLKGILERRTIEWLIPWVKNSQAVIKSGDAYAVALYNKYNKAVMTSFAFSDDDIKAIFAYVDKASKEAPKAAAGADAGGDAKAANTAVGGDNSFYFNVLLGVLLVVLLLLFAVLALMMTMLNRVLRQRENELSEADKEVLNQRFDLSKVLSSGPVLGGIALLFIVFVSKAGFDGLVGVGIQQGYAPKQPIAFSHKLHAGQYEINCAYCHTGVYKGKQATIPSANVCMNCHNAIKRESPEIKKIYRAIEQNKPIEWVRVHNLPDLAYFNHAQHTNVAGLECTNCHGQIQEMEVVQQRAPLTMGWCINCHRQTVVEHAKNNAYYTRLTEFHNKNSNKPMTVENIGGLECSKCHY